MKRQRIRQRGGGYSRAGVVAGIDLAEHVEKICRQTGWKNPPASMSVFSLENELERKIFLSQGKYTLVDDADYDWLNQWKWTAARRYRNWIAVRKPRRGPGPRKTIFMHRQILGLIPGDGLEGDHINHDRLDNRRAKGSLHVSTN